MTLVIAATVGNAVVLAADRCVQHLNDCGEIIGSSTDDKLFVLRNFAAATYGTGGAEHVPTVMRRELLDVAGPAAADAVLNRFRDAPGMCALIGSISESGPSVRRVVLATGKVTHLHNLVSGEVTLWLGPKCTAQSPQVPLASPREVAQNMLSVLRQGAAQSKLIGPPYDFVILNSAVPEVWREDA